MTTEDRTLYTLLDKLGDKTTITLDKFVADILQKNLADVHSWAQSAYDRVADRRPNLGRRQQGDLVRALAIREAMRYLERSGELDDL